MIVFSIVLKEEEESPIEVEIIPPSLVIILSTKLVPITDDSSTAKVEVVVPLYNISRSVIVELSAFTVSVFKELSDQMVGVTSGNLVNVVSPLGIYYNSRSNIAGVDFRVSTSRFGPVVGTRRGSIRIIKTAQTTTLLLRRWHHFVFGNIEHGPNELHFSLGDHVNRHSTNHGRLLAEAIELMRSEKI